MPLDSKCAIRVSSIPSHITPEQYGYFVGSICEVLRDKQDHQSPLGSWAKRLVRKNKQEPPKGVTESPSPRQVHDYAPLSGFGEEVHSSLACQHDSKVGTVSFKSRENVQITLEHHETSRKKPNYLWKDFDLSSNFHGLTVLYEYKDREEVQMDICAIHGLGGNAMDTWTADNDIMWLRDYLPSSEYFTKSRIMTFGYDSDLTDGETVMMLENWAEALLQSLDETRSSQQEKSRPLLFVCHSLGGLVVRKAMTQLPTSSLKGIKLSQCGMVFLATPHTGTTKADWNNFVVAAASVVAGVRPDIVSHLKPFNPGSVWDKKAFLKLDPRPPFRCFSEGRKMTIKGTLQHVVTQDSATLDAANPAFMIMQADHRTICKFASKLGPFTTISLRLNEVYSELTKKTSTDKGQPQRMFGHPRFVAHAYPPHKGAWWEGSEMNEIQYRLALDTPLVGRDEEMHHLETTVTQPTSRPKLTTVKGIAGIGKTELLMRFAVNQRYRRNIFFLKATNSRGLEDAIDDVCNSIGFDMIENPDINWQRWRQTPAAERIQIFISWLGRDFNKESLLILDDAEVFGAASIQAALKYPAWHLVISTRDSNLRGYGREFRDIRLSPLTPEATTRIMRDAMKDLGQDESSKVSETDLQSLAQVVHGHPLAAQNVIPFLLRRLYHLDSPTKKFIQILDSGSQKEKKVFFNFKEKDRSLWEAFNSSLQLLKEQKDSENAVRLLQLLPYLRTDDDSLDSFLQMDERSSCLPSNASEDTMILRSEYLVISEWLSKLRDVSFYVTPGPMMQKSLQIHPLVLQFAQLITSEDAQKHRIRELLQIFYESYKPERTDHRQNILPHVNHCLNVYNRLGTQPLDLDLSSEVTVWLRSLPIPAIQLAQVSGSSRDSENPFLSVNEEKANAFVRVCAETQESLKGLNSQDGHGQAGLIMSRCVKSFRELESSLTGKHACKRLENWTSLEDAIRNFSDMVRSTSIYPDLLVELEEFRQNFQTLSDSPIAKEVAGSQNLRKRRTQTTHDPRRRWGIVGSIDI